MEGTGSGEDVFCANGVIDNNNYNVYGNVEVPHLLAGGLQQPNQHLPQQPQQQQQQRQQHGQQQQHHWWQPGHLPFVQHPPPPPPPQQQQQQQQHQQHHPLHPLQPHNEYFNYNMHAPFAPSTGPSETYSVLPVGHGNFLKVYHCAENANVAMPGPDPASAALYHRQHQQQPAFAPMTYQSMAPHHQQHHQQQPPQPTPAAPPTSSPMHDFNSYELFSSNTIIPTRESVPLETLTPHQQQPPSLAALPTTTSTQTTNMIINKLVNNWSPSLSGGTYSQFGTPLVATNPIESLATNATFAMPAASAGDSPTRPPQPPEVLSSVESETTTADVPASTANSNNPTSNAEASAHATATMQSNAGHELPARRPIQAPVSPPVKVATSEVKKRIVAEVKPMRMTYSDVLSKMTTTSQEEQQQQQLHFGQNIGGGQPMSNGSKAGVLGKNGQGKTTTAIAGERAKENGVSRKAASGEESGRPAAATTPPTLSTGTSKKSPTHENNKDVAGQKINSNPTGAKARQQQQRQPNGKVSSGPAGQTKTTGGVEANGQAKKRSTQSAKRGEPGGGGSDKDSDAKNHHRADKDFNAVYNVTAATKHSDNSDRYAKNHGTAQSSGAARSKQAKPANGTSASRSRYSNWSGSGAGGAGGSANSAYSSKRQRHSNVAAATAGPSSNRHYELAKKILHAWFEYTLKILVWLYYLVYDIVVIGCSVAFERLTLVYANGMVYAKQWRKDWQKNSYKPSLWLRDVWRRFDGRFAKNSKWAVWRRYWNRNPAGDSSASADSGKQSGGRLPQTGEEAMYSLLNCKGKDAYSILGVPPNSSQEQIRKHYKKIAVLVHPDKNKQAGAEEAFKVLQRAFELIGEPENRVAYDHSLAEVLHAEKAWTELHDLLSQLQTKITEAANTIRCSTCGLRHPRKLTERPHYAARECASCKIRHSAREGDIWAETSFLGLRWKYLALMEGKVYDITEWANCQKGALSHLEPNSHVVQYRIVRGAQQQQQQQQQQAQHPNQRYQPGQQQPTANHPQAPHPPHHHSPQHDGPRGGGGKYGKRDMPPSEASLHEFLDNLYSGQNPKANANTFNTSSAGTSSGTTRRRSRRN